MLVYNLVQKYTWEQIYKTMARIYPIRNEEAIGYSHLIPSLKRKPFIKNDNIGILIYKAVGENWYSISGINNNGEHCDLLFMPKKEWIGMEIHFSDKFDLSEEEIFSHVIWAMAYNRITD